MTSSSFHSLLLKDPKAKNLIEERITTPEGDVQVKRYKKEKLLGQGNSGSVYQIVDVENQRVSAAKIVSKAFLRRGQGQQKLVSEIQIHKTLQHPNIVQFEHVFEDKDSVYILLELCQNNTLKSLLNTNKSLTEVEVQYFMYQIIDGLKYIHSKGIVHRDLKLRNIFLSEDMKIKIGDFGLAIKMDPSGEKLKAACGTPNFVAPEVLNQTGYSYEVDIWALGVICYTLLFGKMPFDTVDNKDTYRKIQKADYSFPQDSEVSEPAKDFISKILVLDPLKRPSFDDMLNHPFLSTKGQILKTMPVPIQNTGSSTAFLENLAKNRRQADKENISSEVHTEKSEKSEKTMSKSKTMLAPLKLTVFKRRMASLSSKNKIEDLKSGAKSADEPLVTRKETPSTQSSITTSLPTITEGATAAKRIKLDPQVENDKENHKGNNKENIHKEENGISVVNFLEYPKHGIGYYLSNGSIGVLFHDSTKMILYPPYLNFDYIVNTFVEKKEVRTTHGLLDFPKELGNKVSVLQRFRDYFNKNKELADNDILLPGCDVIKRNNNEILPKRKNGKNAAPPVFMKKWIKTKQAMIFRLTTQAWQVVFQDKTELIINPKKQVVIYTDCESEKRSWALEEVPDCGNEEVINRMTYAQEVIKKARKMEKEAN